jgi:hypothetical protein
VCHVYPKRLRFASHAQAETEAHIDLGLAAVGRLERVPCAREIRKQRDA